MRALTILQPYATLIADEKKFVENRSRYVSYRGELAIHAGKSTKFLQPLQIGEYETGCFLAVAELVDCLLLSCLWRTDGDQEIKGTELTVRDIINHEHTHGPWCLIFANVRKLEKPIPYRGAQGLWRVDSDLLK